MQIKNTKEQTSPEKASEPAQEELAHTLRMSMLGELLVSVAHDVNQPLAAIVANGNACLHWLANDPPDIAEVTNAVARIVRDANRASKIIDRIRAFVRKETPPRTTVDLNQVIGEVLELTESEIASNCIGLSTELAKDLPAISGERVELQQVLLNLIMNSIEALRTLNDRPRLLLVASRKNEGQKHELLILVRDSGPGIPQGTPEALFRSFYTTKAQGLGLGLSISRSIIERHGGKLWATVNELGGMDFLFTLPTKTEDRNE